MMSPITSADLQMACVTSRDLGEAAYSSDAGIVVC